MTALAEGIFLIACAVSVAAQPSQQSFSKGPDSVNAITEYVATEPSSANTVAGQVNAQGIQGYPDVYAGDVISGPAVVTVFVKAGDHAQSVFAALKRSVRPGVTLSLSVVSHSLSDLGYVMAQVRASQSDFASRGIALATMGPDSISNAIVVTLSSQQNTGRATAASVSSAQTIFNQMFGRSLVHVNPEFATPITTVASRDADGSPFSGGDGTYLPSFGTLCTDSWTTRGNASGNTFVLSAGHCGSGTVRVDNNTQTLGTVSRQYVADGANDFGTIQGATAYPHVWKSGSSWYHVDGLTDPPVGSQMTVNGDVSKEHTNNQVVLADGWVLVTDSHYGSYWVGPAGEAQSGSPICAGGDSGGPAYVRDAAGTGVYAAGTIVSRNANGTQCWFQDIASELGTANLSIVTG